MGKREPLRGLAEPRGRGADRAKAAANRLRRDANRLARPSVMFTPPDRRCPESQPAGRQWGPARPALGSLLEAAVRRAGLAVPGAAAAGSLSLQSTTIAERASSQSSTSSFISLEFALSSGAYIAQALAGRALKRPGISARIR
jgi:anti-sigma factor RsiW